MNDRLLSIYLNDHLAGATAGVELVRRAASSNAGTAYAEFLRSLQREIEEDKIALEELMETLGVRKDPIKPRAAWFAEKIGRLKFNGQLLGYSPLSRLLELEGLMLGVSGKLALWKGLKTLSDHDPRLAVADFDELIQRALAQRNDIEEQRQSAAEDALT